MYISFLNSLIPDAFFYLQGKSESKTIFRNSDPPHCHLDGYPARWVPKSRSSSGKASSSASSEASMLTLHPRILRKLDAEVLKRMGIDPKIVASDLEQSSRLDYEQVETKDKMTQTECEFNLLFVPKNKTKGWIKIG